MKRSHKLLIGGAATAAAALKLKASEKLPVLVDTAEKGFYRANTLVMDAALKVMKFPETQIEQGLGSVKKIPGILQTLGITHVIIVTGPTVGQTIVPPIRENILRCGIVCTTFDQVEANPSVTTVEAIRERYLSTQCDGFLAIGGGSPMDAAKAAAARIAKPNTPVTKMAGMMKVLAKLPPIVAVPTTSGTGSEVTIGAVISDHDSHHKYAISDPSLTPKYAVLDASLTVSMPPFVTATTGIDALTHAVESYVTWAYNNNETNRNAEEAVVKIFKYLDRAYNDGNDLEAREQMLIASYKAGLAFTRTGVGYVHAIAHAMGGLYNTAHGLANSVILPIVLEDYGEAVYPQLSHLAELTGVKTSGTDAEKSRAFISAIRDMNQRMGLPTGFDFIREEDFDQIIAWALAEANLTYPVPVLYNEARCRHVLNRIVLEA